MTSPVDLLAHLVNAVQRGRRRAVQQAQQQDQRQAVQLHGRGWHGPGGGKLGSSKLIEARYQGIEHFN